MCLTIRRGSMSTQEMVSMLWATVPSEHLTIGEKQECADNGEHADIGTDKLAHLTHCDECTRSVKAHQYLHTKFYGHGDH